MPSPDDPTPPLPSTGQPPLWADLAAVQHIKDTEHLRLLSLFHYIAGGMAIFFSCLFIAYIVFGVVMLSNPRFFDHPPPPPPPHTAASPTATVSAPFDPASPTSRTHHSEPPAFFGYVLVGMGTMAVLIGWTVGALLISSGRGLARRTGRTFSLVVAGLSCLQVPLGTILGVFTLVVLSRPSVVALYADARK